MRNWEDKIIRNVAEWRKERERMIGAVVVFTNGCFDLLHHGHIQLLQSAKLCARSGHATLVVGINSDQSVRTLKGPHRPVVPEDQRMAVIAALESVDACFIFNGTRCDHVIRAIRPDIWVKGGDYTLASLDAGERQAAQEIGAHIEIIPYKHGISTTELIARSQASAAH